MGHIFSDYNIFGKVSLNIVPFSAPVTVQAAMFTGVVGAEGILGCKEGIREEVLPYTYPNLIVMLVYGTSRLILQIDFPVLYSHIFNCYPGNNICSGKGHGQRSLRNNEPVF